MYARKPRLIAQFDRTVLPLLHQAADGRRMMEWVDKIVETDKWNSFDRFHDTTETFVNAYEAAGAEADVHQAQTGGMTGTGRWIIPEAEDIVEATCDVVAPVKKRVLDYAQNPWHVIQWSASTPADGMTCEMVIADTNEELDRLRSRWVRGKIVLTKMNPRRILRKLADKGAAGVITDQPVPQLPDAVAWTKFGWGGIGLNDAWARLVGLAISENQGKELRALAREHGRLRLHAKVTVRKYVGTQDVVSGIIRGSGDPQDEVWAIAHSAEPGAQDNASGGAVCLEIAQIIEGLIARGELPRPRRTIRLLHGYECYGFFHYLEHARRFQRPLAGVCIDSVGARADFCNGRAEWHRTIPMSAGFVDRLGYAILRDTLRLGDSGYKLAVEPFVATLDTLIGDPKYGYPCPWITTHARKGRHRFNAYHSSADTAELLCPEGLKDCAAAMAAYLYYLADAGTPEALELASAETDWTVKRLGAVGAAVTPELAAYYSTLHRISVNELKRWLWGGDRDEILEHFTACEDRVREAAETVTAGKKRKRRRLPAGAKRVPRRTAVLSPTLENTPAPIGERISSAKLRAWALFWADGERNLADIAQCVSMETGEDVSIDQVAGFFEAHADLGYVDLMHPIDMVTRAQLVRDLKELGVRRGMDLIVHSALSKIGHVVGGPNAVVDALLSVIGKKGTLMFPSFNHGRAKVFNPLTTPSTNGAIPNAAWRRPDAVRSVHPSHAVCAIGPRAEEFCQGHLEAGIWGPESPIGRLIHAGGYILSLGVTQIYSTAYHVAEASIPCPCFDAFGKAEQVVGADGEVHEVKGLAWRTQGCPISVEKLGPELDKRKLRRHGKVGRADSTLVKALDLWNLRREHLGDACSTCTIRPETFE